MEDGRQPQRSSATASTDDHTSDGAAIRSKLLILGHAGLLAGILFGGMTYLALLLGTGPLAYLILALFGGAMGGSILLMAGDRFRTLLGAGILESLIIAVFSALHKIQVTALRLIEQEMTMDNLAMNGTAPLNDPNQTWLVSDHLHPGATFTLLLITYNIPLFYRFYTRDDTEPRLLAAYLLPVLTYLLLPAAILNLIIPATL